MRGIEYEHKKTQKCTEKYLDYTIRTRVRVKKKFVQITLYGRRSKGLPAVYVFRIKLRKE